MDQLRPPESIEARLAAGEAHAAARMLLSAIAHGTFPADRPLDAWLEGLGQQTRAQIVSAFAHYPCFACRNGQEPCDACGGSGFTAAARVCAACVGLGAKRCDFCTGSGLAPYGAMPRELWPAVASARANRALKYLAKLAAQPPSMMAAQSEPSAARRIQDTNKLLGVLENALAAARQLGEAGVLASDATEQFMAACRPPAYRGMAAIRDALRCLAQHFTRQSESLPPVEAANAEAKAEFYEDLLASETFEGTGISHPFLPVDTDVPPAPALPP